MKTKNLISIPALVLCLSLLCSCGSFSVELPFDLPFLSGSETKPAESSPKETDSLPAVTPPKDVVDVSEAEYTYEELMEDVSTLTEFYPDKLSSTVIGTSLDGRDIVAMTLGNPNAKKQIIITVCKRSEALRLRRRVEEIDPHAFIIITKTSEIMGKGFRG